MRDLRFTELLRRWLTGDFGRAHERELRDLADSDDFRREAWEGFSAMPEADHEARLARLRAKLRARNEPLSVKFFAAPRLMAAAAVLVLAVAAVVFFQKTASPEASEPAMSEKNEPARPSPTAGLPAETAASERADLPTDSPQPIAAAKPRKPTRESARPPAAIFPAEMQEVSSDEPELLSIASAPADEQAEKPTKETSQQETQPQVFAAPAPPAVAERAKKLAAERPAAATRSLPTAPAVQHETDAKPDMAKVRRDVADAGLPALASPVGGWDVFREHLRQNARLTPEARDHNVSGTVRLQFVVGADGEPRNFLITRYLGYGCDEEAIRLVKDFEWLPGKNGALTVEVKFVR